MANEAWRAGIARCPHYMRSNARTITCSITGDDGDEIRRRLKTSEDCASWFKRFCARRYSLCPCCQIIEKVLLALTPQPRKAD